MTSAPIPLTTAQPLLVFSVQDYEPPTAEDTRHKGRTWTRIGIAWPQPNGPGVWMQLNAMPFNGTLVVLTPAEAREATYTGVPFGLTEEQLQAKYQSYLRHRAARMH